MIYCQATLHIIWLRVGKICSDVDVAASLNELSAKFSSTIFKTLAIVFFFCRLPANRPAIFRFFRPRLFSRILFISLTLFMRSAFSSSLRKCRNFFSYFLITSLHYSKCVSGSQVGIGRSSARHESIHFSSPPPCPWLVLGFQLTRYSIRPFMKRFPFRKAGLQT